MHALVLAFVTAWAITATVLAVALARTAREQEDAIEDAAYLAEAQRILIEYLLQDIPELTVVQARLEGEHSDLFVPQEMSNVPVTLYYN